MPAIVGYEDGEMPAEDGMEEPDLRLDDGRKWIEKIERAQKREDKWMQDARDAEDIYTGKRPQGFNILHSNVETIVPALYNSTAAPDIRPRYNRGADDTPAYKASQIIEQTIALQADDGVFDDAIERAAANAFISGRGITRVRFEMDDANAEMVRYESVSFKDVAFGSSTTWRGVPWIAYRQTITQDQLEEYADDAIKDLLRDGSGPRPILAMDDCDDDNIGIWEVWDKSSRSMLLITDTGAIIREEPDPLGLKNFFPSPEFLQPITATDSMTPVCPLTIWRGLNDDLQDVSRRITVLTKACRAVGIAIGDASQLDLLRDLPDGEFLVVENMEGAAVAGGLDKMLSYWPVDMVVTALRELFAAREQIKSAIYEITGISDIVRGQSNASETATAQDIKSRWGSIRIRRMQTLIERQARGLFHMTAELICSKFSIEMLQRVANEPIDEETAMMLTSRLDDFRIDVETNSTVRNDTTLLQEEMAQFFKGTAQYFQTMAPIMQAPGLQASMGPILKLYGAFARMFNLGRQADDAIEEVLAMVAQGDPSQAEQQAQEEQAAKEEERYQNDLAISQAEVQMKQMEVEIKQVELQIKQAELQEKTALERDRLTLDERKAEVDTLMKLAEADMEREQQRPVRIGDE